MLHISFLPNDTPDDEKTIRGLSLNQIKNHILASMSKGNFHSNIDYDKKLRIYCKMAINTPNALLDLTLTVCPWIM